MTMLRTILKFTLIALAIGGMLLALVVWKAFVTDPFADVPKLNAWGVEESGQKSRPVQTRVVQMISDEGKIWLLGDTAQVEFQLLSDPGDPIGLPLKIELKRNSLGTWEVRDNAAEHYASLPILAPVVGNRTAGAGCPVEGKQTLDAALALAAENRRRNPGGDCALLARTLAEQLRSCGLAARQVSAWANPQNLYDTHSLLEVYSSEQGRWILLDPTFVGYYADPSGNPLSASEAYRLSAQATAQPDRILVQFRPLEGGVPADTPDFNAYYLSPITMLRHVAIAFGSGSAILGSLGLPYTGQDEVHVPPEIPVSKGTIPPIIEYRTSEAQLGWRIVRETSGLVRLASEGGVVSDGAMLNPDLVSAALVKRITWSAKPRGRDEPGILEPPACCDMQWLDEQGTQFLRVTSRAESTRVRIDFAADRRLASSFRTRARALTPGTELEYEGFRPLFDTHFPLKPGNWRIETTPFHRVGTDRVSLLIHLPPHGTVALSEVTLLTAMHDTSGDKGNGLEEQRPYRILTMKRNLRDWIASMF